MKHTTLLCAALVAGASAANAGDPPFVGTDTARAVADELSGARAKADLVVITQNHRTRGSVPFRRAAEHVLAQLRAAGLDAEILAIPADGEIYYGTQRSRPAWDAEFAELWELEEQNGRWVPSKLVASWDDAPITLAQDSESGRVEAELVDVGSGLRAGDYEGKNVEGKLVLASNQPGGVAAIAVARFGAAGIVSYAQNQRTAWWGEDESLLRWGHLETFAPSKTFAFMVSPAQARDYQRRLAAGERVRLRAEVRAGQHAGAYSVVTAVIPGADPALRNREIVFSCHLDHQKPGANDNASGSVTILEIARTLSALIERGAIARPARAIRFVWPPEIEGTMAYLHTRPDLGAGIDAAIHMDMVGGGRETGAVFHVTRSPASLPTIVNDVAETIAAFVNEQTDAYAATQRADFPLVSPEGGKEALQAALVEFSSGSDHQVYTEGSFRVPAVYLNDWPDRFIHTNKDAPDKIDPTKLQRAGFIGAMTGLALANLTPSDARETFEAARARSLVRAATTLTRKRKVEGADRDALVRHQLWFERTLLDSMRRFFPVPADVERDIDAHMRVLATTFGPPPPAPRPRGLERRIYKRTPEPRGPMSVFGYNYFNNKYGQARASSLRLLSHRGLRAGGYAYEALNLVDGGRTVAQIRDHLSAIYGPVPADFVDEYFQALQSIGVLELVSP